MVTEVDIKKLIEFAVKAPSGHNTQPWRFHIGDDEIQIHPDLTRALPVVDGDNHALYISLGCAAQNIIIAARKFGYDANISIHETSQEMNYISVKLIPNESLQPDELFDFIEVRQSTKTEYSGDPVPVDDLKKLKTSFSFGEVDLMLFSTPDEIKAIEPFIIEESNLQFRNKKFVAELVNWFRFSKKEAKEKSDGLWAACMGFPKMNRFIGNIVMKYFVSPKSEAKRWRKDPKM